MHRDKHARQAGWTLIELIVIMILIGIMTALAIPRFVSPKAGPASRRLLSDIRYAKELAVRFQNTSGNPCCGLFIINSTSYRVFTNNDPNIATKDPQTGGNYEVNLSGKVWAGVTITYPTSFSGNILKFNALGTPYEGSGAGTALGAAKTITVNGPGGPRTVTIEPNTGKVTGS